MGTAILSFFFQISQGSTVIRNNMCSTHSKFFLLEDILFRKEFYIQRCIVKVKNVVSLFKIAEKNMEE